MPCDLVTSTAPPYTGSPTDPVRMPAPLPAADPGTVTGRQSVEATLDA
ncbi:hypothetical protein [Kitasatospora sp. NPDC088779]